MNLSRLDSQRVAASYQRSMQYRYLRERAQKRRERPLDERIAALATNNMAFATLLLLSTEVRAVPHVGVALAVATAVGGFYQLACFVVDSLAVYVDVRALESGRHEHRSQHAIQEGEAAAV
jgi:hypothetical protein